MARSDWTVVYARREYGSRDWRGIEIPPPLKEHLQSMSAVPESNISGR